jgi:hypothetical protein
MAKQTNHWLQVIYSRLQRVLKFQLGDNPQKELITNEHIHNHAQHHCLETFFVHSVSIGSIPNKPE